MQPASLTQATAAKLCEQVLHTLSPHSTLNVEDIQDCVETTLMAAGHFRTARAYIVYREQHARLRRDHKNLVDVAASMNRVFIP